MHSFFIVQGIHDGQVDYSTKIDEVRLCAILDSCLLFDNCNSKSMQGHLNGENGAYPLHPLRHHQSILLNHSPLHPTPHQGSQP